MERTDIRFVAGIEPGHRIPAAVKAAGGLTHRFAVIQETYRPDKATEGMYFDEALWRRLLEFARETAPDAQVGIVACDCAEEMDAHDFLAANASIEGPPASLLVRANATLLLCIEETQYWTQVDGPWPYHDSYTYAIWSNDDVSTRVIRFLREADASASWDIATDVLAPSAAKPSPMRWLWALLSGGGSR
jgi:hypothetical protein